MEYKLPPLPEPAFAEWTDDEVRQYAEQAVAPLLAEIERLEKLAEQKYSDGYDEGFEAGYNSCYESMRD